MNGEPTEIELKFEIDPERDLSFPDAEGRRVLESGEIRLYAGPSSARFDVTTESSPKASQ